MTRGLHPTPPRGESLSKRAVAAAVFALAVVFGSTGPPGLAAGEREAPGSKAPGAVVIPGVAFDGVAFPGPGVVVTVPCGDPLVPLGHQHRLPSWCRPTDVVPLPASMSLEQAGLLPAAGAATVAMIQAAQAEGLTLLVVSAFRSFDEQAATYAYWVAAVGEEEADKMSARPGHSEHQLGTTVDLSTPALGTALTPAFAATPEGAWMRSNASRFGFVMSYPEGAEAITGYTFEPWHFRYVGVVVARDLEALGVTLIEYLLARRP